MQQADTQTKTGTCSHTERRGTGPLRRRWAWQQTFLCILSGFWDGSLHVEPGDMAPVDLPMTFKNMDFGVQPNDLL